MYFCYLIIISPWKRAGPKFGWNWPSGSGEEDFWILSMYFCYFVIISPLEWAGPFIWINLNPLHPRKLLCQVLLKLAQWFWRRWKSLRQRWQWQHQYDNRQNSLEHWLRGAKNPSRFNLECILSVMWMNSPCWSEFFIRSIQHVSCFLKKRNECFSSIQYPMPNFIQSN